MADEPYAFPHSRSDEYGMTLRDWFAGQALASVMGTVQNANETTREDREPLWRMAAEMLYEMADAMLAAREGK